MPRRSAASLSLVNVNVTGNPPRLEPPASLPEAERAIFVSVVAACDPKHFRPSDLPLLVRYVEAAALADQAAEKLRIEGAVVGGRPSPWIVVQEKAVRTLVALSLRLRLAPQSRVDPKTTGRQHPQIVPPWED